jgi:hypothetical protein
MWLVECLDLPGQQDGKASFCGKVFSTFVFINNIYALSLPLLANQRQCD